MEKKLIKREIHEIEMWLASDDTLGLLTKNKLEQKLKYLKKKLKEETQ